MEAFDLVRDDLVTIWRRSEYTVIANSLEEAIQLLSEGEGDCNYSEFLYETEELLDPEEDNNGQATLEIFDENADNLLWSNGK